MVGLLLSVQKVELVGGGWLSENLGSVLLAVAAIAAASLAALVAILNQRRQLQHDRRIQREQLAYDREMRNRDHIRNTIDTAISGVNEALSAMNMLGAGIHVLEQERPGIENELRDPALPYEDKADATELLQEFETERDQEGSRSNALLLGLRGHNTQLELRLGGNHPITRSHDALCAALARLAAALEYGISDNREDSVRAEDDALEAQMRTDFAEFRRACRAWFDERPLDRQVAP